MHLDYTKVIILILWWRNFQLEYWRTFQLVSTLIQPEYRYWTCQKFNGSFWGAYLNGAQFNVGGKKMPFGLFPWLKEHRYAGWLAGGGISYGYHILLNRHWNIEVSVGVGYEYIDYKKYKCPDVCAELLEKGHYHYFGPSKASLSIVYIFN